ncbi:MAG: outer membrane beta-barrel protein [Muribaculaceae bacterium]|nr:outer membrane beta-barrel protein [Muribaculaceae bacterium]
MKDRLCLLFVMLLGYAAAAGAVDLRIETGTGLGSGWKTEFNGDRANPYRRPVKGTYHGGEVGVYLGIGLSPKIPLFLETGLGLGLFESGLSKTNADKYGNMTELRLPVKVGYRLRLGKRSSLSFAFGPYLNWYAGTDGIKVQDPIQVGLTPSVMFRYRKFSVGCSYLNPVVFNGPKELNRSTFMFSIGLTFNLNPNWGGWKYVGAGVAAGAVVAGTVAAVRSNQNHDSSSSSSSSSSARSSSNKGKKGGYGASDAQNSRGASNTYSGYVDILRKMKSDPGSYDDSRRRKIQSDMKRVREANNKNPKNFQIPKSDLEDWDGSR